MYRHKNNKKVLENMWKNIELNIIKVVFADHNSKYLADSFVLPNRVYQNDYGVDWSNRVSLFLSMVVLTDTYP